MHSSYEEDPHLPRLWGFDGIAVAVVAMVKLLLDAHWPPSMDLQPADR